MLSKLLYVVLAALVVGGVAWATPTNLIEIPTATTVEDSEWTANADVFTTLAGANLTYDVGVNYGVADDVEVGVDLQNRFTAGLAPTLNAKWRVTDLDKSDQVAIGVMDWGFAAGGTPNMVYAVASLGDDDEPEGTKVHIGVYYGVGTYLANDPLSFLAGVEFGKTEWKGYIDYIGGNNPRGVFSLGVGYKDADDDWSAKLAYQHYNQSGANGVTLQVGYDF